MSDIEWTDATWNPVIGCSRVSEGCRHCYAEVMAGRLARMGQASYEGLTSGTGAKTRWTGEVRCLPERLADPLHWRKPRRVFVNSMSDLFHPSVPFEFIAAVFGVMAAAPQHTFQILTKRPERAVEFFEWVAEEGRRRGSFRGTPEAWVLADAGTDHDVPTRWAKAPPADWPWPLPNVWLGVSVEDQPTADERIPLLLQCPAAVRWVSAEPLLGAVDLRAYLHTGRCRARGPAPERYHCGLPEGHGDFGTGDGRHTALVPTGAPWFGKSGIDWVVVGGESGPGARPMHPDWARSLRDQCVAAGVAFLFKQWGAWLPGGQGVDPGTGGRKTLVGPEVPPIWVACVGKARAGRLLDGRTWDEYPEVPRG